MSFSVHVATRRLVVFAASASLIACARDAVAPSSPDLPAAAATAPGGDGSSSSPDTAASTPHGEWHLATIRGVVLGLDRANPADTSEESTTPIAGARIQIHKISLAITSSLGSDSAASALQDLGIVATRTTDAQGGFEYVLDDPIIVKTGEPTPLITYRLTISPPAGSPYGGQSQVQVFFTEQLPGGGPFHYYLFRPKS